MKDKILVCYQCAGGSPIARYIPSDVHRQLVAIHNLVEGNFETVRICDDLLLLCNDEGKLNPFCLPNIAINGDIVMGDVIIVKIDDGGDIISLTDEDFKFAERWLNEWALGTISSFLFNFGNYEE